MDKFCKAHYMLLVFIICNWTIKNRIKFNQIHQCQYQPTINEYRILKDHLKSRLITSLTATTQRTHTLFWGEPGKLHFIWLENTSSGHFLSRISLSIHPPSLLSFHFTPSLGSIALWSPFHPSMILVLMWRGQTWPNLEGILIKQGDRLLGISFVYPAEQTSAEVKSKRQSKDQCEIQRKAFYQAASITDVCHWVILHTYLIESQFNHLLKVIRIPPQQPGVFKLIIKIVGCSCKCCHVWLLMFFDVLLLLFVQSKFP